MNKMYTYLLNELNELKNDYNKINTEIFELKSGVSSTNSVIKKLIKQYDGTKNAFLSLSDKNEFNRNEVSRLKDKVKRLSKEIELKESEREKINHKIIELNDILNSDNQSDDSSNVNHSVSSPVYDSKEERNRQNNIKNIIDSKYNEIFDYNRKIISNNIHDLLVPELLKLSKHNDFISSLLTTDIQRCKIELGNSNKIIDNILSLINEIIYDINPILFDGDLKASCSYLIKRIRTYTDMKISVRYKIENNNIDSVISENVLRIIQELCINSIKHSQGTNIRVVISSDDKMLKISESDNGIGFNIEDINTDIISGLILLKNRINSLNGNVSFISDKKTGIKYDIDIPLNNLK